MQIKVLMPKDGDAIIAFEKKRALSSGLSEDDCELQSWHASWRQESLEHYLPLGWSFGIWLDQDGTQELKGYFIAQPLLFTRAMTQTLWVERIAAQSRDIEVELMDVATKMCREKHFQKVVFLLPEDLSAESPVFQLQRVSDSLAEIKTAKF